MKQLFIILSLMFVSMTAVFSHAEKLRTAKVGNLVGCCTAIFFGLIGQKFFEILGVTMGSFYIAGGIIIFLVGIEMLNADDVDSSSVEGATAKQKHMDIAITPFGIPIVCGPVCITSTIALQSEAVGFWQNAVGIAAVICVFIATYCLLLLSIHGTKWLSPAVLKLCYKLSGIILAALAIQMIISGLRHEDIRVLKPLPAKVHVEMSYTE